LSFVFFLIFILLFLIYHFFLQNWAANQDQNWEGEEMPYMEKIEAKFQREALRGLGGIDI